MPNSLVLGLGNPLSGADAFGPAVVERLRDAEDIPSGVELVDAETDLLAYMDQFAERDRVVLVDTVLAPDSRVLDGAASPPGPAGQQVAVFPEEVFSTWDDRSHGAHELSPLMAVKLFRQLQRPDAGKRPPVILLVAHVVSEQDFQRPPSDAEIDAGAEAIRQLVNG